MASADTSIGGRAIVLLNTKTYGQVKASIWDNYDLDPVVQLSNSNDQIPGSFDSWREYPILCRSVLAWIESGYCKSMPLQEFVTRLGI